MLANIVHCAFNGLSQLRFGGETNMLPVGHEPGYAVPTQTFQYSGENGKDDLAVVFIPGFATLPQNVAPGAVGAACEAEKVDFVRFYHPNMLLNRRNLTFDQMVADATEVADSVPHSRVVLASSSFGGGIAPLVAGMLEADSPGRVAGMFCWMSVPPAALLDLFRKQKDWQHFKAGESESLRVVSPTLSHPFPISQKQYYSVRTANAALRAMRDTSAIRSLSACPKLMVYGEKDEVGRGKFTQELARQMGHGQMANTEIMAVDAGHRLSPELITSGLRTVIQRARAYHS